MKLFSLDGVPMACPDCGEAIEDESQLRPLATCESCYVNDECPAHCNDEHDAPTIDADYFDAMFECPTTGDVYYYYGPNTRRAVADLSNWTLPALWADEPLLIDDYWYRDYEDAGVFYCEGCDSYVSDDNYGEDGYCRSCMSDGESDGEGGGSGTDNVPVCAANGCHSADVTHYHLFTEVAYCGEHYTLMARENRAEIPVLALSLVAA